MQVTLNNWKNALFKVCKGKEKWPLVTILLFETIDNFKHLTFNNQRDFLLKIMYGGAGNMVVGAWSTVLGQEFGLPAPMEKDMCGGMSL